MNRRLYGLCLAQAHVLTHITREAWLQMALGLEGPMRSASAGKALKDQMQQLAQQLRPYPHGPLKVTHRRVVHTPRPRACCPRCGYTVPMLKKFLVVGPPICPKDKVAMEEKGDWG